MIWFEVVGYAGAAAIIVSLALHSRVTSRWVGIGGGLLMAGYGVLIGAWPVTLTAVVSVAIGASRLRRLLGQGIRFRAMPLDASAPFLADYLGSNAGEIANSQPEYHPSPHDSFIRLISRDGLPAGIVIGEPAGNELLIKLDYVTPAYRDSLQARWLFGSGRTVFTEAGFSRLVAQAHTSMHRNYLESLGFHTEGNGYVLDL